MLRKIKDLQLQEQREIPCPDITRNVKREESYESPYAQELYKNGVLFSWGYPASILIFKDEKLSAKKPLRS